MQLLIKTLKNDNIKNNIIRTLKMKVNYIIKSRRGLEVESMTHGRRPVQTT